MASCQVFIVRENGDVEPFGEATSKLSASCVIWKALSEKYKLNFSLANKTLGGVEKLAYDPSVPLFERVSLITTFERVWIRRENMVAVINALEDFASLNIVEEARKSLQNVSTLLRQAFLVSGMIGVAFNHVGEVVPYWHVYERLNDQTEDATLRNYNIFSDTGHFEITDELGLKPPVTSGKRLPILNGE